MRDNFESDKEVSFLKLRNMGNIFSSLVAPSLRFF